MALPISIYWLLIAITYWRSSSVSHNLSVKCVLADAESMGSLLDAAGKLQLGVFASGPLQEAALLSNSALQVSGTLMYNTLLILTAHEWLFIH